MAETAPLRVQLIAKTDFLAPPDVPWTTDADGGPALVEFAGRACYQSWSKPNPKTATNAGYLRHIIDVGHFSVLEHASVSFYITGISRSCTHELIRHRHFSYSQLSQRYVPEKDSRVVVPPGMEDDADLRPSLGWPPTAQFRARAVLLLPRHIRQTLTRPHTPSPASADTTTHTQRLLPILAKGRTHSRQAFVPHHTVSYAPRVPSLGVSGMQSYHYAHSQRAPRVPS